MLQRIQDLRVDLDEVVVRIPAALRLSGRVHEAAEAATAASRRFPDDPRPLVTLGHARAQLGDYEAAVVAYEQCLQLDPENPNARENLDAIRALLAGTKISEKEDV